MALFGRFGLAAGGWMLGFIMALCLFGWVVGFDVHALRWLWGARGEQDTELELARLGPAWYVRHDIPRSGYGNWDHVAIGPAGIFMIESKRLRGRIELGDDELSSGRIRLSGKTFRGAAVGLRNALASKASRVPWVQAVVAVWGDLPGEPQEREDVIYLKGQDLVTWLESRETAVADERLVALTTALQQI